MSSGPAQTKKRRVVIVEDDLDLVELLKEMLEDEGHEVSTATDGRAAVALIQSTRPDVVLCDVGLPGFDGHEVARAVRSDPTLASTRLIALSGWTRPQDVARARASGFDLVLGKPLGMDSVIAEVERSSA
ncbi:MAG TPA: response regulator [Polyangiaceae bacterium]|nr:response regulator [Polyangiaceae bacterium]